MVVLTSACPSNSCTVRANAVGNETPGSPNLRCRPKRSYNFDKCSRRGTTREFGSTVKDRTHFDRAEYDRKQLGPGRSDDILEPRQLDVEHLPVKKQESLERLILSGS